jgi:hypothetical protein
MAWHSFSLGERGRECWHLATELDRILLGTMTSSSSVPEIRVSDRAMPGQTTILSASNRVHSDVARIVG